MLDIHVPCHGRETPQDRGDSVVNEFLADYEYHYRLSISTYRARPYCQRQVWTTMSLTLPSSDESRLMPSVSIDPSPADYQHLQELLQQALKREADAMRKISHLHQQLMTMDGSFRSDCKYAGVASV